MTIYEKIGKRIKMLRKSSGYKTQKDLAAEIGCDPSFICMIEKGRQNLTIGTLAEILSVLHITFSDFFDSIDTNYPSVEEMFGSK